MEPIYYLFRTMWKFFILCTFMQHICAKDLDMNNDDEFMASVYLKAPVKPVMKFYFFNLTNPDDFLEGAIPIFNEVGPFAYKATLVKEDVKWINDGLIEFVPKVLYRYNPRKSKGNRQFEKITTLNMPLISALHSMKNAEDDRAQKTIASFVEILGQKPYVTQTVRDLLWGYDNQLLNLAMTINDASVFPEDKVYPYSQFGFFVGKNDTNIGKMRVASGLQGNGHLAEVKEWKEPKDADFNDNIGVWSDGSQCDKVMGSDGFVFRKNIKKDNTVKVFNRNFCRSLSFKYQKDMADRNGINGYRFVAGPDNYEASKGNSANSCFCSGINSESALCGKKDGLFDVSECQYGAPVLVSWPHFFQGDSSLLNDVVGLSPDAEKHSSYYDISKNSGITLSARVTTQINAYIDNYPNIEQVKGLKEMVYPIMWSSLETDGVRDKDTIERFKKIDI